MKSKPDGVHQQWGADGRLQFEVWYAGILILETGNATAAANCLQVAKREHQTSLM